MTTLGVDRDDFYPITNTLPQDTYAASTANLNGTVLLAANMVGSKIVFFQASGQTSAQGITTDTGPNIVAQLVNQILVATKGSTVPQGTGGWRFSLWNANTSSGIITLTAGTGVTITGTNTVAVGATRTWFVVATPPGTVTMQDLGSYVTT